MFCSLFLIKSVLSLFHFFQIFTIYKMFLVLKLFGVFSPFCDPLIPWPRSCLRRLRIFFLNIFLWFFLFLNIFNSLCRFVLVQLVKNMSKNFSESQWKNETKDFKRNHRQWLLWFHFETDFIFVVFYSLWTNCRFASKANNCVKLMLQGGISEDNRRRQNMDKGRNRNNSKANHWKCVKTKRK